MAVPWRQYMGVSGHPTPRGLPWCEFVASESNIYGYEV